MLHMCRGGTGLSQAVKSKRGRETGLEAMENRKERPQEEKMPPRQHKRGEERFNMALDWPERKEKVLILV